VSSIESLFNRLDIAEVSVRNRIAFAPCSRHRASLDGTPTEMMIEYYRQRASAGLIIAEATAISPMAAGYLFIPGLYADAHVAAWRRVTDAVHIAGGRIVAQLLHAGRLSDSLMLPNASTPVAPSAVRPDPLARHYTTHCPRPKRSYGTPRALTLHEVRGVIDEFVAESLRARAAGFDGVEIHAASGYLPMQFLCANTNVRTDEYGSSVPARAKFLLDCVEAIQSATSCKFVAVKISPGWTYHDVFDDDPVATYSYVAAELSARGIAYLHVGNFGQTWDVLGTIRPLFNGPLVGVHGFSRITAAEAISTGLIEMIAFGQAYIANPDLVARFQNGWPLNSPERDTFYTQGVEGYTDYPEYAFGDRSRMVPADSIFGVSGRGGAPTMVPPSEPR
jgi:N-ethylmaleimide reductase